MNEPRLPGAIVEQIWPVILSELAEGVLLLSTDAVVLFANEMSCRLLGLHADAAGKSLRAAVVDPAFADLAQAILAGDGSPEREIAITQHETVRLLSVRAISIPSEHVDGRAALLILSDITAQRALENIGSDFVANVSHELRTPVSIIAGYIENLADFPRMPRPEQAEVFGIMQDHATRLKALLDDLLTLACFDSHRDVLNYAPVDLLEFLARIAKDWQRALDSKDMKIILEIPEEARCVTVDRYRFEQVMHNLFDNAFKYTQIEGLIRVRSLAVDDHIEISVEDNGAGIPEEDLPHIFERFYRVDKARSRKFGGTGLGLSIVKHIVALHGGNVRAESTHGMSTHIVLRLPKTPPPSSQG